MLSPEGVPADGRPGVPMLPTHVSGVFCGGYAGLTVADNAHRLEIGMDTRELELFHCARTAMPAAPRGVCMGAERNGST
ncbi:MAG TPA: hypothetical protein VJY65_02460, partial [Chloroflexota bacterium]|nr:hypothetical protein [Chloroflexota bacterium]